MNRIIRRYPGFAAVSKTDASLPFCLALALILLTISRSSADSLVKWHARFGLGYEAVSQGYYVATDSTDQLGSASLETTTLDDVKGLATVGFDWRGLQFETGYDQSPELWRLRARSGLRLRTSSSSLRLWATLDRRSRYDGQTDAGDDYLLATIRGRTEVELAEMSTLWLGGSFESIDYDSTAGFTQSATTTAIRAGYTYQFGLLSSLTFGPFYQSRTVSDSTPLNYSAVGLEGNFLELGSTAEIDALFRLENRSYNRSDSSGDYFLIDGTLRHKFRFGGSMLQSSRTESELYLFRASDYTNPDFWRFETRQLLGTSLGAFELQAGPQIGWLQQAEDSLVTREDYFESGLVATTELVSLRGGTASLEGEVVYRKLAYPTDYLTNFWGLRLTFIGDHPVVGGLTANLFFTSEWEWHRQETENSQIYLVSGGLNYRL